MIKSSINENYYLHVCEDFLSKNILYYITFLVNDNIDPFKTKLEINGSERKS